MNSHENSEHEDASPESDRSNWLYDGYKHIRSGGWGGDPPIGECHTELEAIREFMKELCQYLSTALDEISWLGEQVESLSAHEDKEPSPRVARDKWIYESVCDVNKTMLRILGELKSLCNERGWPNTIGTEMGVYNNAVRFAKKNRKDPVPSRKG